mmetsp:Transcript_15568/g.28946  ORF Transcript_15568/g.28946 Transcript_15568/m.28946 type:complete len:409 (+) Transcript_15568:53-1279(+)
MAAGTEKMAAEPTCESGSFEAALHEALTEALQALAKSATVPAALADALRVALQEAHRRLHIVHKRCILQLQAELEQARMEIAALRGHLADAGLPVPSLDEAEHEAGDLTPTRPGRQVEFAASSAPTPEVPRAVDIAPVPSAPSSDVPRTWSLKKGLQSQISSIGSSLASRNKRNKRDAVPSSARGRGDAPAVASDAVPLPTDIPAALQVMLDHCGWQHMDVMQLSSSSWCIGGLTASLRISRPPDSYEEAALPTRTESAIAGALSRVAKAAGRSPKAVAAAPAGNPMVHQGRLTFLLLASMDDGKNWESLEGLIRFFNLHDPENTLVTSEHRPMPMALRCGRSPGAELAGRASCSGEAASSGGADSPRDAESSRGAAAAAASDSPDSDSRLSRVSSSKVRLILGRLSL